MRSGFNIRMLSLCITILTLGFISGVSMKSCPEQEDIYPCECYERHFDAIAVYCVNLETKQLEQALNSLRGKQNVELNLEKFTTRIPWKFFAGIGIQMLKFYSCRVDSLTNDDQPGLLDIEELAFYENSTIPLKLDLGYLPKLRTILMWDSSTTELGDDWLSNVPSSLDNLYLRKNNIKKIGLNVFSQLNSLKKLYLEGNRSGPIKRSMFPTTADRLEYLSLEDSELTNLPADLFIGMPSIKEIYLEKNGITTLDQRTWYPIWHQLHTVVLDDNNIICDDRLNWIIKSMRNPQFYGKCSAPKEFQGKSLYTFFQSKTL